MNGCVCGCPDILLFSLWGHDMLSWCLLCHEIATFYIVPNAVRSFCRYFCFWLAKHLLCDMFPAKYGKLCTVYGISLSFWDINIELNYWIELNCNVQLCLYVGLLMGFVKMLLMMVAAFTWPCHLTFCIVWLRLGLVHNHDLTTLIRWWCIVAECKKTMLRPTFMAVAAGLRTSSFSCVRAQETGIVLPRLAYQQYYLSTQGHT